MDELEQDHWISDNGSKISIWVKENFRGKTILDLLDDSGMWKEDLIKETFLPIEAETILNIPRLNTRTANEVIWDPDPKIIFSVKSSYNVAVKINAARRGSIRF